MQDPQDDVFTNEDTPQDVEVPPQIEELHVQEQHAQGEPNIEEVIPNPIQVIEDLNVPIALRKSSRSTSGKLPARLKDYNISNYVSYNRLGDRYRKFVASLASSTPVPRDWEEAKLIPKWKAAMLEELGALEKNDTWELVTLPPGKKAVGCKWVFKIKKTPNGTVERYKARLVAEGGIVKHMALTMMRHLHQWQK
ncbi:hypothetical protein QYE76_047062 [Lolium multiflorum]|uniref:Reverse transcriptase Ty1/copia-type domain-containing protein n=1 Tax=Lolium multiflorum TaxID=4521 RepID=A0AAD8TN57_LOLMU|nr:hypothetical protein QYE76_047062 [Lolium multiflorum]